MKKYTKLKELAEDLHRLFHRVCYGKNPDHKNFNHDYYTSALAYFDKRFDDVESKIKESNVEIFNKIVDLEYLKESMKEISKQQKYLWQTLEEKRREYFEGDKLKSKDGTEFILSSREASILNDALSEQDGGRK